MNNSMDSLDKGKLLQFIKDKHAYNNFRSGLLKNLIYDIESGYFDLKGDEDNEPR